MLTLFILFAVGVGLIILKKKVLNVERDSLIDRLLEFVITVCVTGFSFYGAYLLAQKRTDDEKKQHSLDFVQSAILKCDAYASFLYSIDHGNPPYKDSTTIYLYNKNNIFRAFFVLDAIPVDQALTYFSSSTYRELSILENDEKVAIGYVPDSSRSMAEKLKGLIYSHRFDNLRMELLRNEEQLLKGKISDDAWAEEAQKITDSAQTFTFQIINSNGGPMK